MGERRGPIIIGLTIAVVIGVLLLWAFSPGDRRISSANLNAVTEKDQIQSHVQVSHLGIATSENYFGHKIRVTSGVLTNVSDKAIRQVELKLTFTDYEGKPVLESVQNAYSTTQRPLDPAAAHRFEISFENLPRNWNYRVPVVEVVKIAY
jgi:hypothetical protein